MMSRDQRSPFAVSFAAHAAFAVALVLLSRGNEPSLAPDKLPFPTLVFAPKAPASGGHGGRPAARLQPPKPRPTARTEAPPPEADKKVPTTLAPAALAPDLAPDRPASDARPTSTNDATGGEAAGSATGAGGDSGTGDGGAGDGAVGGDGAVTEFVRLSQLPARLSGEAAPPVPPQLAIGLRGSKGIVLVRLSIDRSGHVVNAEIVRSQLPQLDAIVLRHVRGWVFAPPLVGGRATAAQVLQPFSFRF